MSTGDGTCARWTAEEKVVAAEFLDQAEQIATKRAGGGTRLLQWWRVGAA